MKTRLMTDAFAVAHVANEIGDKLRARCLGRFAHVAFVGAAKPKDWTTCLWCATGTGTWR